MNFDFSDEQQELRASVRRYLSEACPLPVVRRVLDGPETHATEVWQGLAELGCQAASIPEAYGGLGLSPLNLCVIAEELGRAVAPVPFSSSIYLAAEAILRFATPSQKQTWLPKLADGSAIGTFALADAEKGLPTTWRNGQLSGTKGPVADAEAAHVAVVRAGDTLVLVDLTATGVRRERVPTIDPTRKYGRLTFDGAPAEPLGAAGAAEQQRIELQDAAAVYMAFEQIGGAEAAMMMARDYAIERFAFGKPIGAQQAVKHKLAEMYIAGEIARSNAYYAAMMLASGGADLPVAAAAARIGASKAYLMAAQEGVQIHGGIGFTWEANPHLHYRRARLLAHTLGTPAAWKERLVSRLERRNAS